jgi:hypothetical protein
VSLAVPLGDALALSILCALFDQKWEGGRTHDGTG